MRQAFDFEIDMHGARVVVMREPICSGCLSDWEVDCQIESLKQNLDAVAKCMKAAIRKQAAAPLIGAAVAGQDGRLVQPQAKS